MTRAKLPVRTEKRQPDKQIKHVRRYDSGKVAVINPKNIASRQPKLGPRLPALPAKPRKELITPKIQPKKIELRPRQPKDFKLGPDDAKRFFKNSVYEELRHRFDFINVNVEEFWEAVANELEAYGINKFSTQKEFDTKNEWAMITDSIFDGWAQSSLVSKFGDASKLSGLERRIFVESDDEETLEYFFDPFEGKLVNSSEDGWIGGPTKDFKTLFYSNRFHHPEEMQLEKDKDKADIIKLAERLDERKVPFFFITENYNSGIWVPKSQEKSAKKLLKELEKSGALTGEDS